MSDPEVEGTVPSQWWLDLKLENQQLRALAEVVRTYIAEPTLENERRLAEANAALAAVRVEER